MRHLYLRKSSFKKFFGVSIGRRNIEDEMVKESGSPEHERIGKLEVLPVDEPFRKPTWKCFSYEEIFETTNGFHAGNCFCSFREETHFLFSHCKLWIFVSMGYY